MKFIRNINERFGDPIIFSGESIDDCVSEMQDCIRDCGYDSTVTADDYEEIELMILINWDFQDPANEGWSWRVTINGESQSGPYDREINDRDGGLADAVVDVAYQHGLEIEPSDVHVDWAGLYAHFGESQ